MLVQLLILALNSIPVYANNYNNAREYDVIEDNLKVFSYFDKLVMHSKNGAKSTNLTHFKQMEHLIPSGNLLTHEDIKNISKHGTVFQKCGSKGMKLR